MSSAKLVPRGALSWNVLDLAEIFARFGESVVAIKQILPRLATSVNILSAAKVWVQYHEIFYRYTNKLLYS